MSIYGNPVMLGGSGGGGGGDVPLLTRAQWNALTTVQKQAYGLVAIQDANSGFDRGELYYGADYRVTLLEGSVFANILAETFGHEYENGDTTWGGMTLYSSENISANADGSIRAPGTACAQYTLPADNTSVTLYGVIKAYATPVQNARIVSVAYASSSGNNPTFIYYNATSVKASVFNTDLSSIALNASSKHVYSMSIDASAKKVLFFIDGAYYGELSFNNCGATVRFTSDILTGYTVNGDIYYCAIVSGAESNEAVIANQQRIMAEYEIS